MHIQERRPEALAPGIMDMCCLILQILLYTQQSGFSFYNKTACFPGCHPESFDSIFSITGKQADVKYVFINSFI